MTFPAWNVGLGVMNNSDGKRGDSREWGPVPGTSLAPVERSSNVLRLPPHNIEVERALLGAMLLNNRAYDHVVDFLKAEHFTEAVNGRIFAAMSQLIDRGVRADPVSLKTYLEGDEMVVAAGGIKYLASLSHSMVTTISAGDYGRLIFDLHIRRELIGMGEDLVNAAFDSHVAETAGHILEEHERRLFELGTATSRRSVMVTAAQAGQAAVDLAYAAHRLESGVTGVPTGLTDLDYRTGGLQPGDLIILAGRPSMGKSALATNIAYNAAGFFKETERPEFSGKCAVFFSLEMSAEQLGGRLVSSITHLDSHKMRIGALKPEELARIGDAAPVLEGLPLMINYDAASSVNIIRTRARREARRAKSKGVGLIVVDYLQMIAAAQTQGRQDGRVLELGAMTRGLKALGGDLGCPVLVLSQLSRKVEERDDKRPMLADLRESGAIEQDADVVAFVYREEYYLERHPPTQKPEEKQERYAERHEAWNVKLEASRGVAECIIAKQRMGPVGTVRLHFDGPTTTFSNLARVEKSVAPEGVVWKAEPTPVEQLGLGLGD